MKGYTRKVGLRQPDIQCFDCWMRLVECEHPDVAWAEIRARRAHKVAVTCDQIARVEGGVVEGPATPVPARDQHWLRNQVRRSAATLDGLPPEMRETLAHRTSVRKAALDPEPAPMPCGDVCDCPSVFYTRDPRPTDPHPCPHCLCTQTTECCYCDGTRTPLEDS